MSDRDFWENPVLKIRLVKTLDEENRARADLAAEINLPEAKLRILDDIPFLEEIRSVPSALRAIYKAAMGENDLDLYNFTQGVMLGTVQLNRDNDSAPEPQSKEQPQTYSASYTPSSFAL